jgi:hypothetical protein
MVVPIAIGMVDTLHFETKLETNTRELQNQLHKSSQTATGFNNTTRLIEK